VVVFVVLLHGGFGVGGWCFWCSRVACGSVRGRSLVCVAAGSVVKHHNILYVFSGIRSSRRGGFL